MIEHTSILTATKCSTRNLVVSIWPMFAEVTENECIIERHLRIIDASLICVRSFSTSESHSTLLYDRNGPTSPIYGFIVCPSVHLSVCHTRDPRLNGSINMLKMHFAQYDRAMLDARILYSS